MFLYYIFVSSAAMYNVNPSNVILVHDDLDRPVGKYSLKHGGSAGGHNGVRSAIASLSSDTLKRVRVGIGRPGKRDHVTDYVLSKFEPTEIPVVQGTVEKCCKVLIDELQLFRTQSNDTKDTETSEGARVQCHTQQQSVL